MPLPFLSSYRFRPHWGMTLLAMAGILFLSSLGVWQLHRAQEKIAMLAAFEQATSQPAQAWNADMPKPAMYQSIKVSGCYLPVLFFFDNQHHQHQFGYHVISPLVLSTKQVVLVDRGWVVGDPQRQVLPSAPGLNQCGEVKGQAYYPSDKNWILGQELEQKDNNKYIIERIDTELASQVLQKSVYPFIIRLDKNAAEGFVREWPVVAMSPARHYGYALQWFLMAAVVLIIYVSLNLKKKAE